MAGRKRRRAIDAAPGPRRAWRDRFRREAGGGTGFLIVFLFSFFVMGLMIAMFKVGDTDRRMAQAKKYDSIAINAADSALDQTLSRVRNNQIKLPQELPLGASPTPTAIILQVPVGVDAYSTTAAVRIDFAKNTLGQAVRDFEGNLQYEVASAVTNVLAIGTSSQGQVRRGVTARFTLVNFGRYMSFTFENDAKTFPGGEFYGPYHVNKNTTMNGYCDWNSKWRRVTSPVGSLNPFYDPSYTTVVAGNIIFGTNPSNPVSFWSTKNTTTVRATRTGGGFDVLPVPERPQGTWIDGAHGGFVIKVPEIPFRDFSSVANVVLMTSEIRDLGRYTVQGQGFIDPGIQWHPGGPGAGQIDPGLETTGACSCAQDDWPVKVNLNALNKGRGSAAVSVGQFGQVLTGEGYLGETDAEAQANYETALASEYGLVIYVDGNAAIWGKLPPAAGVTNLNKKVTVICTGHAQIIGDVLHSGSPYDTVIGDDSYDISPTPTVNNPTNDAIAILSGGNCYVNPWRRNLRAFFWNNSPCSTTYGGDMRLSALLYAPRGVTGGAYGSPCLTGAARGYQRYRSGCRYLGDFTFHGALVIETSGYLPGTQHRLYDPVLKNNLSRIIPSGTVLLNWRESLDIHDHLFVVPPTPTP